MEKYIFYEDRLVSVAQPYMDDNFVSSHYRSASLAEVDELLGVYKSVSVKNKLLTGLLEGVREINTSEVIRAVDIGVFMGSFSIGIDLAGKDVGVALDINAYEANPLLIASIIKNFKLYEIGRASCRERVCQYV